MYSFIVWKLILIWKLSENSDLSDCLLWHFENRPCLLKLPAVLQIALLKTFRCAVGVHFLIVYDFTRFRCAENHTPQDHFRCVIVCFSNHTSQEQGLILVNKDHGNRTFYNVLFVYSFQVPASVSMSVLHLHHAFLCHISGTDSSPIFCHVWHV